MATQRKYWVLFEMSRVQPFLTRCASFLIGTGSVPPVTRRTSPAYSGARIRRKHCRSGYLGNVQGSAIGASMGTPALAFRGQTRLDYQQQRTATSPIIARVAQFRGRIARFGASPRGRVGRLDAYHAMPVTLSALTPAKPNTSVIRVYFEARQTARLNGNRQRRNPLEVFRASVAPRCPMSYAEWTQGSPWRVKHVKAWGTTPSGRTTSCDGCVEGRCPNYVVWPGGPAIELVIERAPKVDLKEAIGGGFRATSLYGEE